MRILKISRPFERPRQVRRKNKTKTALWMSITTMVIFNGVIYISNTLSWSRSEIEHWEILTMISFCSLGRKRRDRTSVDGRPRRGSRERRLDQRTKQDWERARQLWLGKVWWSHEHLRNIQVFFSFWRMRLSGWVANVLIYTALHRWSNTFVSQSI